LDGDADVHHEVLGHASQLFDEGRGGRGIGKKREGVGKRREGGG
jgi:hypothetical protein